LDLATAAGAALAWLLGDASQHDHGAQQPDEWARRSAAECPDAFDSPFDTLTEHIDTASALPNRETPGIARAIAVLRDQRGLPWLDELRQDLRYALRTSRKAPAFTAVAVLTLAIGIGASTALFSVVHGVLLKPLPYRDADRLVVVMAEQDFEGARRPVRAPFPLAAVTAWPSQGKTFDRIAFYSQEVAALPGAHTSELIDMAVVSGSFFETVAGDLVLGRGLLPFDDLQPAAVISERLWRRLYASAPDVLGQSITLPYRPGHCLHDDFDCSKYQFVAA
jgi:hypothetical protein